MEQDAVPGLELPPSIEATWGVRQRPPRGPKRGLSLERIVSAAVKVAGTDGLAAVSMSRVAAELGASTMSLYRYVGAKDELLTLMVDAAYGPPPASATPGGDWRATLTTFAEQERAALMRNPWVVRIPLEGPPLTPNSLGWLEWGLSGLHGTHLREGDKLEVMLLVTTFVRAEVSMATEVAAAWAASGLDDQEGMTAWVAAVTRLADRARFPALHRVLESGIFELPDDPDYEFSFGLRCLLDGVDALVRARRLESQSDGLGGTAAAPRTVSHVRTHD